MRVDDLVQFLNPGGLSFTGRECCFGQARAIDCAIGIENRRAEVSNHFVEDRLTMLHQFVSNMIRLNYVSAEGGKHLCY